jgi:hypothetical protein
MVSLTPYERHFIGVIPLFSLCRCSCPSTSLSCYGHLAEVPFSGFELFLVDLAAGIALA